MNKRIIFVEDDSAITDIYGMMMKKAKFDVEFMASGDAALKKIKAVQAGEEEKPDLFLLDLVLPDMNGMDILKFLRQDPKTKDVKVFILTNQSESQLPDEPHKPDKFIIKAHVTPTQLLEMIKEALA